MQLLLSIFIFLCSVGSHFAFAPTWSNIFFKGNVGGNGSPPPPVNKDGDWKDDGDHGDGRNGFRPFLASSMLLEREDDSQDINDIIFNDEQDDHNFILLSDANPTSSTAVVQKNGKDVVAGAKSTFETSFSFWSNVWNSFQLKVKNTLSGIIPNRNKDRDDDIDPSTIPVQRVIVSGSDILPDSVVRAAGQRSGMIGSVMEPSRVNECAKHIKKWYMQRGYVLHSVKGATLHVDNGTATLTVQEPILSSMPVDIRFAKEVPIDPETGQTTTLRRYREKLERRKARAMTRDEWMSVKNNLNTTLIEAEGRTNPNKISKRLDMYPGDHFRWDSQRWLNIAQSGIFSKIWRASPVQMNDGTVQLQVLAQEAPPRNLEYGITKSLYTGHWEGELDFKHDNLLGGGESLGFIVRRGAKDPEPTMILRFTDDKFGLKGGYDVELFSDNLAADDSETSTTQTDIDTDELSSSASSDSSLDAPLNRRGLKFSLRGPVPSTYVRQSSASVSVERTMTKHGYHESIGSGTLTLGPFLRMLPLGARSSITTTTSSGARLAEKGTDHAFSVLPYTSGTVISRQVFPLLADTYASSNGGRIKLALQQTIFSATSNLPRHEAIAAGNAARVRGHSGSNGSIDASITGSAEIRIPVTVPFGSGRVQQDASLVAFADWMGAKNKYIAGFNKESVFQKSSYGLGIRKSVQGIPLKYDITVTKDGKMGHFFGLGFDWDL